MWKWIGVVSLATFVGGAGYVFYDLNRAGYLSVPELAENQFALSFQGGLRAIMTDIADETATRNYYARTPEYVPPWFEDVWSICREPTSAERNRYRAQPGERFDAVCEIDADGDVFIRGWVSSVPKRD